MAQATPPEAPPTASGLGPGGDRRRRTQAPPRRLERASCRPPIVASCSWRLVAPRVARVAAPALRRPLLARARLRFRSRAGLFSAPFPRPRPRGRGLRSATAASGFTRTTWVELARYGGRGHFSGPRSQLGALQPLRRPAERRDWRSCFLHRSSWRFTGPRSCGRSTPRRAEWREANRLLAYLAAFGAGGARERGSRPAASPAVLRGLLLGVPPRGGLRAGRRGYGPPRSPRTGTSRRVFGQPFGYWNALGLTAALGVPGALPWLGARRSGHAPANALAYPLPRAARVRGMVLACSRGVAARAGGRPGRLVRDRAAAPARRDRLPRRHGGRRAAHLLDVHAHRADDGQAAARRARGRGARARRAHPA